MPDPTPRNAPGDDRPSTNNTETGRLWVDKKVALPLKGNLGCAATPR